MAETVGITDKALSRWLRRRRAPTTSRRRGRTSTVSAKARWRIRRRYVRSLRQWGPAVLACWARRQGLGTWSPTTVARIVEDLRPSKPATPRPKRYRIALPGAMWSEDGASFRQSGAKRELLLAQDECSRMKTGWLLADGPADGADVRRMLETAFERHGAPLVLKRDGGSIFDAEPVRKLLEEHGVVTVTSPPGRPQYNGRMERAVRDVRSHERAQREYGLAGDLERRLGRAVEDLNQRPRPVLGGWTAREVFHDVGGQALPDRREFRRRAQNRERELVCQAASRKDRDAARRRAVEDVLCAYGLMEWTGNVSTDSKAATGTS